MKKLIILLFSALFMISCEIDNYDSPDATIQGTVYDQNGQPFQVGQGSGIIRMREISWAKDSADYVGNQTLKVMQDGTYRNTKWFSGTYRMLPYAGAFYPYDDELQDGNDAGDLVKISNTTTKDFTVTPYLTIEWVDKPTVTSDNRIMCTVRFKRNQKLGYEMPDVREAWLLVSNTVNTNARLLDYYPKALSLTNDMEEMVLSFVSEPVKYVGVDYWIRVSMNCQTAVGKPETNYPGMGSNNYSTIEKVHVP
ncbi:DUF3823 domain-containing protein [uncultured Bacteroides sp.]|uniref:DUF3823 domain-containing protein n=1 Tax=uncultured Bacteroides sp. TaxID=162156 RepID=UPI002AA7F361|nr:DUF3823 domain-containing protein [uncultured Bacteroides sp.]